MNRKNEQEVILGLGSNLGDRVENLARVLEELPPKVVVTERSSLYQTKPWGYLDQPDFLNQVISVSTSLPPKRLLRYIKKIEKRIGRKPSFRYGPRQVDIDILLYGDLQIRGEKLTIPHPRLEERAFVLVPLIEIKPDLILPGSGKPISEVVKDIDRSDVQLLED